MRIVCISDTHTHHRTLDMPEGDVLVHTGDSCFGFASTGEQLVQQLVDFNAWLGELPYKHKVIVAGNHDFPLMAGLDTSQLLMFNATYLQDSGVEIDGVKFWGSPWQPEYGGWAFNLPLGAPLAEKWDLIPSDTDVLLTHTPPHGILDGFRDAGIGCPALRKRLKVVAPKVHVFGHAHVGKGQKTVGRTRYVNAAQVNQQYIKAAAPIVVDV